MIRSIILHIRFGDLIAHPVDVVIIAKLYSNGIAQKTTKRFTQKYSQRQHRLAKIIIV